MSEIKPKKVVGRSVAIALGIVCVLLIASLGGAMAYYTMTINDKNSTIDSINAQLHAITGNNTNTNATDIINQLNANITNLTNERNQLQGWLDGNETLLSQTQTWLSGNITDFNNYVNDHSYTNEQYQNLQNQISSLNAQITQLQTQVANLQAPKLIQINLKAEDNRPFLQQSYLHVYGYVCNVGTNTAYNAVLYVEAYIGAVLAFNTTISLGTINGESYTSVDSQVAYSGNALTTWHVWSNPTGINMAWA